MSSGRESTLSVCAKKSFGCPPSLRGVGAGGVRDGPARQIFRCLYRRCPPLPIPNREVKPARADGIAVTGGRVGRCRILYAEPLLETVKGFAVFGRIDRPRPLRSMPVDLLIGDYLFTIQQDLLPFSTARHSC